MDKINDSPDHPLRFVDGDTTIGQYYSAKDMTYHLGVYPQYVGRGLYLCGKYGNLSPSRNERESRTKCEECFDYVKEFI